MAVNNIDFINNSLLAVNYDAANSTHKRFRENTSQKPEESSVQITISEEGKQAYRSQVQSQDNITYEEMLKEREHIIDIGNKNFCEADYGFAIGNKLTQIKEGKEGYRTWEEKSSELLEAYASIYDEIVQGYEDGSISHYVMDKNEESGYRRLSLEEELAALDKAYDGYVSFYETQAKQSADVKKAFEDTIAKLDAISRNRSEGLQQMKETYENMSKEEIPENIAEKLSNARQSFWNLYSQNKGNNMDIKSLLANISVFS